MVRDIPSIIVTGASGFVGRNFLAAAADDYRIFALARRTQKEVGVPPHPNIIWVQVDITDWPRLKAVMDGLKQLGGVDGILHLAAHYDFSNRDSAEYQQTNVNGTRHLLEMAKWLCVKRFVFASSVAACPFPLRGEAINEESPPDAEFPYARSKRAGEAMAQRYSSWFPCTVVRFAAVYSDWCEYLPLYEFLRSWLCKRWDGRILAGRGESAVSYVHIADLNRLLLKIFSRSQSLPNFDVYVASPNGATSHGQLYSAATRAYFGDPGRPLRMPRQVLAPGIILRQLLGRLSRQDRFERLWMLRYVDRQLTVDSSYTQTALSWHPSNHLQVLPRIPYLIANFQRDPDRWQTVNTAKLARELDRLNLSISNRLEDAGPEIVAGVAERLQLWVSGTFKEVPYHDLNRYLSHVVMTLTAAVRSGEPEYLQPHIDKIAHLPFAWGCSPDDVCKILEIVGKAASEKLGSLAALSQREKTVLDCMIATIRMAENEIEDSFDRFDRRMKTLDEPTMEPETIRSLSDDLDRFAAQLNAFYRFGERNRVSTDTCEDVTHCSEKEVTFQ